MRKLLLYLLICVPVLVLGQGTPASPTGPKQVAWYYDTATGKYVASSASTWWWPLQYPDTVSTIATQYYARQHGGGGSGVSSFNTRTGAVTLTSLDVTSALGFTPENIANKATNFGTLNNTLYPTTQAVSNYITAFGYITAGSANTLTNKAISGSTNTLTNIPNSSLTNNSITINGNSVALGGSTTVTATASNSLTFGAHLTNSGASYNGSTPVTILSDAVSSPTASTIVSRDANANTSVNNIIQNAVTTLNTGSHTTTLTAASAPIQIFTGAGGSSDVETVVLPLVSTLSTGQQFTIINNGSAATSGLEVNVTSSGGNMLLSLPITTGGVFIYNGTSGTTAASWVSFYNAQQSLLNSNNSWTGSNFFNQQTTPVGEIVTDSNGNGTTGSLYGTAVANAYIGGWGNFTNTTQNSTWDNFSGGSATYGHVFFHGQSVDSPTSDTVSTGTVGANVVISQIPIVWHTQTTVPLVASLLVRAPTVSSIGAGSLTNAATAFFQNAPTATVTGSNYDIWAIGLNRMDSLQVKNFKLNGSYGAANQIPQINPSGTGLIWASPSGVGTVTLVSASNTQGVTTTVTNSTSTPNIAIGLSNITPTSISTTIKPATIYQTPTGTAGTDSVMVKHSGGTVSAIAASYYATSAGNGTVISVTSANSDISITNTTTTPVLTVNSTSAATASTIVKRDANTNTTINNLIENYQTIATATGTTTLTVSSPYQTYFTGTTTQTVTLPVTSTLVLGQQFQVVNNSTGIVTVQSSGANTVQALAASTSAVFTCILTSGTTAASWSVSYASGAGTAYTATRGITLVGSAFGLDTTQNYTWLKVQTVQKNNITTSTTTDGLIVANNTASTSGTTVQNSPVLRFTASGWNTGGTPAANQGDWKIGQTITSGGFPDPRLNFEARISTAGTGSYTNMMYFDYYNGLNLNSNNLTTSGNVSAASGTVTALNMLTGTIKNSGATLFYQNSSFSSALIANQFSNGTLSHSSGEFINVDVTPTYNETSTASDADIVVNRTETALGSGTHRFIDFRIAGTSKFYVDNKGIPKLPTFTVSTLPAAGTAGRIAVVTDATAPTYLGTLTGGGSVTVKVLDNGSAWVAD